MSDQPGRSPSHACKGVEQPYMTASGVDERHFVCDCGLLLSVLPGRTPSPLVGIGQDCLVVLDPKVMTPDEADALALALIRAADRCRRHDDGPTAPARGSS